MRQLKTGLCLAFVAIASFLLSACGSKPQALPALSSGSSSAVVGKQAVGPITATGTIVATVYNEFTLQTGYPHGFIDVHTNSSTQFIGQPPFVNEQVTVVGTGSWDTSITATTVTQSVTIQASGTVTGIGVDGKHFTMQTGYPHGFVNVTMDSNTKISGGKLAVGEDVYVTGTGTWETGILAYTVAIGGSPPPTSTPSPTPTPRPTGSPSPSGSPTPTPGPTTNPSFPPNGPNNATMMLTSPGQFGAYQIFDQYGSNLITQAQGVTDGPLYGAVWGARPGMPNSWRTNTQSIQAAYYMPQSTDLSYSGWGSAGHTLSWWTSNHPDWILYACDPSGNPTSSPAWLAQLPYNVPLDIHNPAVVAYQVQAGATYAKSVGYNALSFDQVLFSNPTGSALGAGYFGCGIYSNGSFVRRYVDQDDPAWEADTLAWAKQAHGILQADNMKLIVNHPTNNISDPNEQTLLSNVDADLDEVGFSDYGNWKASFSLFKTTVDWMRFAQAHGAAVLVGDKFSQSGPLTSSQLEYVLATYMMGNEGGAGLFAGNSNAYGSEQFYPQYKTSMGPPCGDYYGDKNPNSAAIWYRSYTNALAIVNGGSTTDEYAHLPTNHNYVDIMGRPVTNPLLVSSGDAYVLLTTNGCH